MRDGRSAGGAVAECDHMEASVGGGAVAVLGLNHNESCRCVTCVAGVRGRAICRWGVRSDEHDRVVALDVQPIEADVIDAGRGVGDGRRAAERVEPRRDAAGGGDQSASERAALGVPPLVERAGQASEEVCVDRGRGGRGGRGGRCALVAVSAVVACVALVALVALAAWVAFVAESALLACDAFGTVRPLALILDAVTAPFLILLAVTALCFNCLAPTLFLGSLKAAKLVPPSAMSSATNATTSAGLGRRRTNFRMTPSKARQFTPSPLDPDLAAYRSTAV